MAKYLRCYMCSDLHAANRTYRKLLNAIKMNVYEANVVLIAGDLTGKAIVPIIAQGNGSRLQGNCPQSGGGRMASGGAAVRVSVCRYAVSAQPSRQTRSSGR